MAKRLVSVDENYIFPAPLEARLDKKVKVYTDTEVAKDRSRLTGIEGRELPDRGRLVPADYPGGLLSLTTYGRYAVWTAGDATTLGLPAIGPTEVMVYGFGNSRTYHLVTYLSGGMVEWRRRASSGVWVTEWERLSVSDSKVASYMKPGTETARAILELIGDAPEGSSRVVPLSLTVGTGSADAQTEGTVRYPLHYSPTIPEFRVHVVDVNPRYNSTRTGTSTLTNITIGPLAGAGGFNAKPKLVAESATVRPGQAGWVSDWMQYPLGGGAEQVLSMGYSTTGGTPTSLLGAGWSGPLSVAGERMPTLTPQGRMPFHVWIEAKVDASTPVIAALGSSSSCGQGATRPVLESFVSQHARHVGALPVHHTEGGTSLSAWSSPGLYKWKMWDGYTTPDALIWNIGSNDVYGNQEIGSILSDAAAVMAVVRGRGIKDVYAANIPPRLSTTEAQNATRLAYNEWMKDSGEFVDVFDFSATLSDDGRTMRPEFDSGDGTHYNTAGHVATNGAIHANMVNAPWRTF